MERQYTVYQITSPCGGHYIGYTSLSLAERWRCHKERALSGYSPEHPFYNAIRNNDPDKFIVEPVWYAENLHMALAMEKQYIAKCPVELRLNLSPGGSDDARFGGKIFWERLNQNPEEKEAYLKRLTEGIKRTVHTRDYETLAKKAQAWREEHPVEVYKNALRASRIARNKKGVKVKKAETTEERKKRLMWKYKNSEARSKNTVEIWNNRTEEDRKTIGNKISASLKKHMESLTVEERRTATAKARAAVDRERQGKAIKKGIKRFWEELRKDPERYKDHVSRRTATLKKTLSEARREDI